jgi:hypothetical protein
MIQVSSSSRWQAARRFAANTRAAHVESAQTHRAQELLSDWRKSDEGRDGLVWSPKEGPVSIASCPPDSEHRISYEAIRGPDTDAADVHEASLEAYAHRVLNSPQPLLKAELTHKAWREYRAGTIKIFSETPIATPLPDAPARPAKPALVPARQIPLLKNPPCPRRRIPSTTSPTWSSTPSTWPGTRWPGSPRSDVRTTTQITISPTE